MFLLTVQRTVKPYTRHLLYNSVTMHFGHVMYLWFYTEWPKMFLQSLNPIFSTMNDYILKKLC